jgi:tetratricopeptide (TPR) repeat protein
MQAYVCAEIAWHLRGSGIFSDGAEMGHKQLLRAWLGDVPQDEIVLQTGQVLGVEKLCEAANRAEAANDWWLAGRLWSIACMIKAREEGSGATTFEVEKSLAALERVLKVLDRTSTGDAELNADVHEVLLQRLGSLMMLGDVESMQARTQLVDLVRTTDAAEQDPINATLLNFNVIFPTWFSAANLPDSERKVLSGEMFAAGLLDAVRFLAHAEKTCSDAGISYKCSLIKTFWIWFVDCFLVVEPALDWDALMGEGGSEIQAALDSYEYETGHRFLTETVNCDGLVFLGWLPLLLHYGNVEATLRAVEKFMPMIQRVIEEPDLTGEYLALTWCLPSLALFAKLFDFPAVMQSQIYACLQAAHLTWTEADERANQIGHPLIRRRGEKTKNHFACGVELTAWMVKCAYVLVAADLSVSPKEILASLPNVEDIINDDITCDTCMPTHMLTGSLNIWIHLGAVCEKLGAFEATVRYTTAALSTDLSKGGTLLPVARSLAHAMRGRAYAKLGQLSAAVPAFEAAADGARQCQLWFLEYKALSDLERCVPGQVSRGMENAGRLAEVVRRLHGPLEMLRSTMHQPNTADKRQGVPLANVDRAATRATLMGMRVMELQRRAVVAGVAEEQIENALDADDPKSELVILVLRAQATDATADRLRGELQALKWMALQQRALTDGVIEADVEDAMDSADPRQRLIALILARS